MEQEEAGDYQMLDWLETEPGFLYTDLSSKQQARLKQRSKYGHLLTWGVARFIVKSGDDLRLE